VKRKSLRDRRPSPIYGTTWASESTDIYNDVKHADRRDPSASELYEMLIKNRLVFRMWLARRLGVSDAVIDSGMWRLKRGLPDNGPAMQRSGSEAELDVGAFVDLADRGAVGEAEDVDVAGASRGDESGEAVGGGPAVGGQGDLVAAVGEVGLGAVVACGSGVRR
jgi:hypothetical protein